MGTNRFQTAIRCCRTGDNRAQTATDPASAATDPATPTPARTSRRSRPRRRRLRRAAVETPHSLFDQTWHQFQFGGRATSIDGDPARFQRYQDVRDGVHFTDARYATSRRRETGSSMPRQTMSAIATSATSPTTSAPAASRSRAVWDEIPQFYSVDTATPYTHTGDNLVLDDATQRLIQNGQGNLSSWIPLSPKFELHERRDVGSASLVATPKPQLDLTATYTMNRHVGELPWGASFGFGNDVEVALPYDSRTNDFSLGAQWNNTRNMLSVAYTGSWFDNLDTPLIWDSPLRLDDSTSAPGRGRTSLWPSNSAQTVSIGGFAKFAPPHAAHRLPLVWHPGRTTKRFSRSRSIRPCRSCAAPGDNRGGGGDLLDQPESGVPSPDWTGASARGSAITTTPTKPRISPFPQYVSYDTSVNDANTGGPELYAHSRTNFDADATWTRLHPVALTVGYSRNNTGHDFRIFENTGENVLRLTADAAGSQWFVSRSIRIRLAHRVRA